MVGLPIYLLSILTAMCFLHLFVQASCSETFKVKRDDASSSSFDKDFTKKHRSGNDAYEYDGAPQIVEVAKPAAAGLAAFLSTSFKHAHLPKAATIMAAAATTAIEAAGKSGNLASLVSAGYAKLRKLLSNKVTDTSLVSRPTIVRLQVLQ